MASTLPDFMQVALKLDRNPLMQVILADKSLLDATVQPPGPGAGGGSGKEMSSNGAESGEAIIPGRNFIDSWPLDLSAFLAGESAVTVYAGHDREDKGTIQPKCNTSLQGDRLSTRTSSQRDDNTSDNKRFDAPPAPEGLRYMRLSVCLPWAAATGGDQSQRSEEEQARAQAGSVDDTTGAANSCPNLVSAEAMQRLNPLSIKITFAGSLPGVRIEAESLQDHVKPTHFRLLETHCKPVYVVCRPFPDDPLIGSLHPRVVWTAGSAQRDRARFDHTSAFLLGPMDRHNLEEWAENSMLSVEVHDRCVQLTRFYSALAFVKLSPVRYS